MKRLTLVIALGLLLALGGSAPASVILGTGTGALLTSDLSDPGNDINDNVPGNPPYFGSGYDWVAAFSNSETHFSPGGPSNEAALDLFDNQVGGGSNKWYDGGVNAWVALQFDRPYILTHFTVSSANDAAGRDPDIWHIQGSSNSTDGQDGTWTDIYTYSNDGTSRWTARNQVVLWESPMGPNSPAPGSEDFATPGSYSWLRYDSDSVVSGSNHQISEIEYFGTAVPPAAGALLWDGTAGSANWGTANWLPVAPGPPPPPPSFPDNTIVAELDTPNTVTVASPNRDAHTLNISNSGVVAIGAGNTLTVLGDVNASDGTVALENNATLASQFGGGTVGTLTTNGNATVDVAGTLRAETYDDQATPGMLTKRGNGTLSLGTLPSGATDITLDGGTFEVSGQFLAGVVPSGPIGHWKLDEAAGDASDSSGHGRTATLSGNPVWQPAGGKFDGALELDGSGDYATVPGGANRINIDNSSFSTSFWTTRSTTGSDYVIGQGNSGSTRRSLHIGFRDNNTFTHAFWGDDLNYDNNAVVPDTTDWHHWVTTYDATTNRQEVWMDGDYVAGRNTSGDFVSSGSNDFWLGRRRDGNNFAGLLDEVVVYDRALSPGDIAVLYAGGLTGPINMTGSDVTVLSDSTLNAVTASTADFGNLFFTPTPAPGQAILTTSGAPGGMSFLSTTITAGDTVGFNTETDTTPGAINGGGLGATIVKAGSAELILNQAGSGLGGATFDVQEGRLVSLGVAPLDAATVQLDGGEFALSSPGGDLNLTNAVTVVSDSGMHAGQFAGGVGGPVLVTLSNLDPDDAILTLRATDGYSFGIPGTLPGTGGIDVAQGPVRVDEAMDIGTLVLSGGQLVRTGAGTPDGDVTIRNELRLDGGSLDMTGNSLNTDFDTDVEIRTGSTLTLPHNLNVDELILRSGSLVLPPGGQVNADNRFLFEPAVDTTVDYDLTGSARLEYRATNNDVTLSLNNNNTYTGITQIHRGALEVLPNAANLAPGRLEFHADGGGTRAQLMTSGSFTRGLGAGDGEVRWDHDGGGFAARGGNLTVNLHGDGRQINWDGGDSTLRGRRLKFGHSDADSQVEFVNPLHMGDGGSRHLYAFENPNLPGEDTVTILSGHLTSASGASDNWLDVHGPGTLWFTDPTNDYQRRTNLYDGVTLRVGLDAAGLGPNRLRFSGPDSNGTVLEGHGVFTRNIADSDGPNVYWQEDGGFSAYGGPFVITLEPGLSELDWGSGGNGFRGRRLHLGSRTANDVVELTNDIDGENGDRYVYAFDNPQSPDDYAVMSGTLRNFRDFRVRGDGLLVIPGRLEVRDQLTVDDGPTLRMTTTSTLEINDEIQVEDGSTAEILGTVQRIGNESDDDINIRRGSRLRLGANAIAANFDQIRVEDSSVLEVEGELHQDPGRDGADVWVVRGSALNVSGNMTTQDNVYVENDSWLQVSGQMSLEADLEVERGSVLTVLDNGLPTTFSLTVGDDIRLRDGAGGRLTGDGSIFIDDELTFQHNSVLAPGDDGIGTLSIEFTPRGSGDRGLRFQGNRGGVYEFEVGVNGETHDLTDIVGDLRLDSTWTVALLDGGLGTMGTPGLSPHQELELFIYSDEFLGTMGSYDLNFGLMDLTMFQRWDASGAQILHDATGKRVYLTGLLAMPLPEPGTCVLLGAGLLALVRRRRRRK